MPSENLKKYNSFPSVISLDHDLHNEHYGHLVSPIPYQDFQEKTGYDCLLWLIEFIKGNKLPLPILKVHSLNEVGKQNIIEKWIEFQKQYLNQ
jgi:hypothetical protein